MRGLSPVVESGGHSSSRCAGLSLSRPLLLRSTGSSRAGSVVVAHWPSCSAACGIFPDQGSNPCPLHWQADSQPLRHQGSPIISFYPVDQLTSFGLCLRSLLVLLSPLWCFLWLPHLLLKYSLNAMWLAHRKHSITNNFSSTPHPLQLPNTPPTKASRPGGQMGWGGSRDFITLCSHASAERCQALAGRCLGKLRFKGTTSS